MALSSTSANNTKTSRKTGWSRFRPVQMGAALLLSTGVLSAAAAVAAAREPDPLDAYGPPPAPISVSVAPPASDEANSAITPSFTAADPSVVASVPAIITEVKAAPATVEAEADTSAEEQTATLAPATTTPTSSTVESPELVASSWSMSPLPEGEGGTVTSSTSVDPITPTSSMVASPQ